MKDDLISRQAAIDAVEKIKKWNAVDGEGYQAGLGLRYTDVIDTLTELPSAQPDLTADIGKSSHRSLWGYEQALCEIKEWLESMPSAEPKRGHWELHIFDGIMGGRPRAWMCDNCNCLNVYKTDFCPNCGARMEGLSELE